MSHAPSVADRAWQVASHGFFGFYKSFQYFRFYRELHSKATVPFISLGVNVSGLLEMRSELSSEVIEEVQQFVQLCMLQGGYLDELAHNIESSYETWLKTERRSKLKRYVLDVSPIQWAKYFCSKILHGNAESPLLYPIAQKDQVEELFDLVCSQIGKSYCFLEELRRELESEPTEMEVEDYLREKYRQLLGLYIPAIHNEMSAAEFSELIREQYEKITDVENVGTTSVVEMRKITEERMMVYLQTIKFHATSRKYRASKWLPYTIIGGLGLFLWVKIHLFGYGNCARYIVAQVNEAWQTFSQFMRNNVQKQLKDIYHTVRYDEGALEVESGLKNLEAERSALASMVVDYTKVVRPETVSSVAQLEGVRELAKLGDLSMIMDDYATAVSAPVSSAVFGRMIQLALIQVHKLKVDGQRAVVSMDKIMKANTLNFQFLGLIPAGIILGLGIRWIYGMWYPKVSTKITGKIRSRLHKTGVVINKYNVQSEDPEETFIPSRRMSWVDKGKIVYNITSIQETAKELPQTYRDYVSAESRELLNPSFNIAQKVFAVDRFYHHLAAMR